MKITPDTTIAGLPAYRIRTLLRAEGKTVIWPLCSYAAFATPGETLAVLQRLVDAGQLRLREDIGHVKIFERTSQATTLADAVVPAPLTVPEALAVVGQVIEFLRARAQDDSEELEVAELRIIGELVAGTVPVPHVEIGVILRQKMRSLNAEAGDPHHVDVDAAEGFLARLAGIHPSLCVRRLPPASTRTA